MSNSLNKNIVDKLSWRYATKKFDESKKISDSNWKTLEDVLSLAPSSYGLQPYQFIIVQNSEIRKKLTPAAYGQAQIESCSHLVIVTHLKVMNEQYIENFIKNTAKTRGTTEESLKDYQQMIIGDLVKGPRSTIISPWSARQAYIAMGAFITAASLLDIDVCPMEGFNSSQFDDILNLTNTKYTAVSILAAGYRATDDNYQFAKKVRTDKDNLIKII
jgi:nitroreductase